jgi:hypothetical protein
MFLFIMACFSGGIFPAMPTSSMSFDLKQGQTLDGYI